MVIVAGFIAIASSFLAGSGAGRALLDLPPSCDYLPYPITGLYDMVGNVNEWIEDCWYYIIRACRWMVAPEMVALAVPVAGTILFGVLCFPL